MARSDSWEQPSGAVDSEDPCVALVLRHGRVTPYRSVFDWSVLTRRRSLHKIVGTLLGALAVCGLLQWSYAGSRTASAETTARSASAIEGLSAVGQGYMTVPDTECWMRMGIGQPLLNVGPKACQSSCDYNNQCKAFEMYGGNRHCMLLSDCKGWSSHASGVYVMVKEPAFFGLPGSPLKLPPGVHAEEPQGLGPAPVPSQLPAQPAFAQRPPAPAAPAPPARTWPARPPPAPAPPAPVVGQHVPAWVAKAPRMVVAAQKKKLNATDKSVAEAAHFLAMRPPTPKGGFASVVFEGSSHPLQHKTPFSPAMYGKAPDGRVQNVPMSDSGFSPYSNAHEESTEANDEGIVSFHAYRAQSSLDYPLENVNVADLPGVIWYLHNEVVTQCPRKYNISRVLRIKLWARVTKDSHFIPFVAFDNGKCTVPGCNDMWQRFGYNVGCQSTGTASCYGSEVGHWYSLPGPCPEHEVGKKGVECRQSTPGGACQSLAELRSSAGTCNYYVERDGEIPLEQLTGISDYSNFCRQGNLEYDRATDRGRGTSFWDGKMDVRKSDWRLKQARQYLATAFPSVPMVFGHDQPRCHYVSAEPKCEN